MYDFLWGILMIVYGVILLNPDSDKPFLGIILLVVGAISIIIAIISRVSKSPKVKIIQAIEEFILAGLLLLFLFLGDSAFDQPWINIVFAGLMIFFGVKNLIKYSEFKKNEVKINGSV